MCLCLVLIFKIVLVNTRNTIICKWIHITYIINSLHFDTKIYILCFIYGKEIYIARCVSVLWLIANVILLTVK